MFFLIIFARPGFHYFNFGRLSSGTKQIQFDQLIVVNLMVIDPAKISQTTDGSAAWFAFGSFAVGQTCIVFSFSLVWIATATVGVGRRRRRR